MVNLENIIKNILKFVLSVIVIFALLMVFIEARLVFSFDWTLYDSSFKELNFPQLLKSPIT